MSISLKKIAHKRNQGNLTTASAEVSKDRKDL